MEQRRARFMRACRRHILGPNVAMVNLAMESPGDAVVFNKEKGKYHANVNILGIAYKPDVRSGHASATQ